MSSRSIRRQHVFDSRSLLLFAGLTLGGTSALLAQTAPPSATPLPIAAQACGALTTTPLLTAPAASVQPGG